MGILLSFRFDVSHASTSREPNSREERCPREETDDPGTDDDNAECVRSAHRSKRIEPEGKRQREAEKDDHRGKKVFERAGGSCGIRCRFEGQPETTSRAPNCPISR